MKRENEYLEWLDRFIEKYGDIILALEEEEYVVDNDIAEIIRSTAEELEKMFPEARITCEFQKPFKSMAYIAIEGEDFIIENTQVFANLIKHASNLEVYATTNGMLRMNLAYNGIAKIK